MQSLLTSLLRQFIREGNLALTYADGSRETFGDGTGPVVAARITDKRGPFELVRGLGFALGELYMDGRFIMTEGSIYDFYALFLLNARRQKPPPLVMAMLRIRKAIPSWPTRNDRKRSKGNVAHHYDLNGKLFELFLDRGREYSCAYFERSDMDLDEAQRSKERHIAAKLLLEPGLKVLDIGSGWGGLALYLARHCGSDVTGITLSEEQVQAANISAARAGLADRARFRLEDYREVDGVFDRIVSVGMFEHVGSAHFGVYFEKVARLLSEDGVALIHTIGSPSGPQPTGKWLAKYIFPGGQIPALSEIAIAAERSGLFITDVEVLRMHYAKTLHVWRERFLARRDEAVALYDERFCRMWEYYLAISEVSFRAGVVCVFQVQLARANDRLPITRDYIAEHEALLRKRDGVEIAEASL